MDMSSGLDLFSIYIYILPTPENKFQNQFTFDHLIPF